jgi:hypothetical protein
MNRFRYLSGTDVPLTAPPPPPFGYVFQDCQVLWKVLYYQSATLSGSLVQKGSPGSTLCSECSPTPPISPFRPLSAPPLLLACPLRPPMPLNHQLEIIKTVRATVLCHRLPALRAQLSSTQPQPSASVHPSNSRSSVVNPTLSTQ